MSNRNKCTQYFLTFPRWETLTDLGIIKVRLPPVSWIFVVQEDHDEDDQDLNRNSKIHYHVSLIFKKGIAKSGLLAWLQKEWPSDWKRIDVQATKSFQNTLDYLRKESNVFYEYGTRPGRKISAIEKWIRTEADRRGIDLINPGIGFSYNDNIFLERGAREIEEIRDLLNNRKV